MKKITALALAAVMLIALCPSASADGAEDYIALTGGVSMEMMSADYWLSKKNKQAAHKDKVLMSTDEIAEFNRGCSAMISCGGTELSLADIPDSLSGEIVRGFISSAAAPEDPVSKYLWGQPTNEEYWAALEQNRNLDAVPGTVEVRFGYSVARASLRLFPSNDFIGGTPEDRLYDKLVMSEFMPYLPLAVLHESTDGEWYYVMLYGFGGWIEKKNVAICTSREDWENRMEPESFLTVTGRELRLAEEPYSPGVSGLLLPMGTKLPLVRPEDVPQPINCRRSYGCYVVKLPVRLSDGTIGDEYTLVPMTEDVSTGYLPYTRANVIELAFKLLGDRYGWAGMYGANDCSGIVHEVYACFGFCLPRTAEAIMKLGGFEYTDMSAMSDAEKLRALDTVPAGSLLGFPGHIMIYLGRSGGRAYVISAVGSFGPADMQGGYDCAVNSVTVNSLADTRRRSGKTWLESLDGAILSTGA